MSYKIIVARYNENIEWLLPEMDNCIIYNKGPLLNLQNEICLENVGRESETYLHYIIENYDNLPDILICTQADIKDHRGSNDIGHLICMKTEALHYGKSTPYVHSKSEELPWWQPNFNLISGQVVQQNYYNNEQTIFRDWFEKFIDVYPEPIVIYTNGIFAVKKELVLSKPLQYYKELIKQVNHHINPTEGHYFERSWYYIFSM